MAKDDIRLPVTCDDCGNRFEVPIAGVELKNLPLTCPACGKTDHLTQEQADAIVGQVKTARAVVNEHAAEELRKTLKRATRGSKVLKYRSK